MTDNSSTGRRRLLQGLSTATVLALAGCTSSGGDVTDTDGDGVIDSEDYAPRDPDVQRKSDTGTGDSTTQQGDSASTTTQSDVTYPSHTGTHTITARDNFWAWELSVAADFTLNYRAINARDENYDFDVLLYTPANFEEYRAIANEVEEGVRPEYLDGSAPGVESGVEATARLTAGTYYLVIDNTDLSDAGDWGTEETRRVRLDASTGPA